MILQIYKTTGYCLAQNSCRINGYRERPWQLEITQRAKFIEKPYGNWNTLIEQSVVA